MENIKQTLLFVIVGTILFFTFWFWSTIQLIFLLSIGLVFAAWGENLREDERNYALVPSVIGFVLSLVILLNYTPTLISQMEQEDVPAASVIEEPEKQQGVLNKIFGGESEPEEPEEPSLLDQYLFFVILMNVVSMGLSIKTFVTRTNRSKQNSKQTTSNYSDASSIALKKQKNHEN